VVQQLQERPYYLYLYLDALVDKDPLLASDFADNQASDHDADPALIHTRLIASLIGSTLCPICPASFDRFPPSQ